MAGAVLAGALLVAGCERAPELPPQLRIAGAAPAHGRVVVERAACTVCHVIPGVRGPGGRVGPPLSGFGARTLIAGAVPNRPDLLVRFVRDAPAVVPNTAMPPMPIGEQEARDVAAFLYTLR